MSKKTKAAKMQANKATTGTTAAQASALAQALATVSSTEGLPVTTVRRNGKLVSVAAPAATQETAAAKILVPAATETAAETTNAAPMATVTAITAKADGALAQALQDVEILQAGNDALVLVLQRIAMLKPTAGGAEQAIAAAVEILAPLKAAAAISDAETALAKVTL
jgi:hypothetical protein